MADDEGTDYFGWGMLILILLALLYFDISLDPPGSAPRGARDAPRRL